MHRAIFSRILWYALSSHQRHTLTHIPQTWLDERLFGWSKSATRGTSAWAGSAEISRAATPDASDDEDEPGDYDDLLGFLAANGGGTGGPSRSRARSVQNSYADLQKLRMSSNASFAAAAAAAATNGAYPKNSGGVYSKDGAYSKDVAPGMPHFEPNPALDDDGLHMRHGPRVRKASLSDGVSVERISELPPQELFEEATRDLNQEISKRKSMHEE